MFRKYAPSIRDVQNARRKLERNWGKVEYDEYFINQQGNHNKYYYTAICHDDKGMYHAVCAWGPIGYWPHMGEHKKGFHLGSSSNPNEIMALIEKKESDKEKRGYQKYDVANAEGVRMNEMNKSKVAPIAAGTALALLAYSAFTGGNLISEVYSGAKRAVTKAAENKKKGCGCGPKATRRADVKHSEYSLGQINPVEVEGAEDVYGAEQAYLSPQSTPLHTGMKSLKMW